MTVFEDAYELRQNNLQHDTVPTAKGPRSIERLFEARDRFERLGNDRRDGCLAIDAENTREIPRGWVSPDHDTLPDGHEGLWPLEDMTTVLASCDGAFICQSDAVCLDMTILQPDGVVAIDFERGETDA
ncbi:hypothetical protein [Halopiger goleimassiliensis]|uniref:hypothetical protein n=1 Tax=Halopiger goleimassiliensis TaxID=1293048 RepID=UPI0006779C3B|nr:hypothetical protein [Halopiger goleimassiliensis]